MSEVRAPYAVRPTPNSPPVVIPVDPRLRLLLIAVRQALYIIADALGEYCGLAKRV